MSKLKIAVIGTGLVGTFHAEAFFRNPNSELVAVCDVDKEKVNSVAQSFNCKAYEDFTKLINTETLDAISIATPEQIRIEPAVMSVKKGLKILLEKPLGRNLEKIHELVDKIKDWLATNERNDEDISYSQTHHMMGLPFHFYRRLPVS